MTLHTWGLLTDSPSDSAWIMWIDDDSSGADHTFRWGESSVSENSTTASDPDPLKPLDDANIYGVQIDGLDPDTEYVCEIDGESETRQNNFRTVTDEPFDDGLTIGQVSDPHPYRGDAFWNAKDPDGKVISDFANEDCDILLACGDFPTSFHSCIDSDWGHQEPRGEDQNALDILSYLDQYHQKLNEHHIVPIVMTIGNHEWGFQYDPYTEEPNAGVGCTDDIAYYTEMMFPNMVEYAPDIEFDSDQNANVNYNYEITIGDELQIICFECTSQKPWESAETTEKLLRDDVDMIISMSHYGFWCSREHDTMKPMSYAIRSHFLPLFEDYPVRFTYTGHDHMRSITHPFYYSETEPNGVEDQDWEELEQGDYVAVDLENERTDAIVEFGNGWGNNRDEENQDEDWAYDQLSLDDYETHYIMDVGNSITVEERDMDTETRNTITFNADGTIDYHYTDQLRNCILRNATL